MRARPSTAREPGGLSDAAAMPRSGAARSLCTFDTAELGEVSGIALSSRHPDIVWMTNDSEGGPYLYAVDTNDCSISATLTLLDTPARDHEALAIGRDAQGNDVIWVGDIGDNQRLVAVRAHPQGDRAGGAASTPRSR